MSLVQVSWVPPTTRKSGAPLDPSKIVKAIVSLVDPKTNAPSATVATAGPNADGSPGTTVTFPAPVDPGTYRYGVQTVDDEGDIADVAVDQNDIVIADSPPAAVTNVQATLLPDQPAAGASA